MKIFFDAEFTGLHQYTTLISIGFVSENGYEFYAEFDDYDPSQVDEWLQENVINHLIFKDTLSYIFPWQPDSSYPQMCYKGERQYFKKNFENWLYQLFDKVTFWGDCSAYDWVLLAELIADRSKGYPSLPGIISYHSPCDIRTLFEIKGIDPDISREKFAFGEYYAEMKAQKHNALWDAKVIKACYGRLSTK